MTEQDLHDYNFGALAPLPAGYRVVWSEAIEHYMAIGPQDWESAMHWSPHACRRWCFDHALSTGIY